MIDEVILEKTTDLFFRLTTARSAQMPSQQQQQQQFGGFFGQPQQQQTTGSAATSLDISGGHSIWHDSFFLYLSRLLAVIWDRSVVVKQTTDHFWLSLTPVQVDQLIAFLSNLKAFFEQQRERHSRLVKEDITRRKVRNPFTFPFSNQNQTDSI